MLLPSTGHGVSKSFAHLSPAQRLVLDHRLLGRLTHKRLGLCWRRDGGSWAYSHNLSTLWVHSD